MNAERVEEFVGPAHIVEFPSTCKGNAEGRKMVLELVGDGDRVEVLIPAPMDLFQGLTGVWLSTYNLETNVKGKIPSPKDVTSKKKEPLMLPGKVRARRGFLRQRLYKRTAEKPRLFRVWWNPEGQLVLFKDRPYRNP